MEFSELPPFVCDDIHFNSKEMDSYNKPFNYCICTREAGKSTDYWRKQYNIFRKEGNPGLVLRRMETDVTDLYIGDIAKIIWKFTGREDIELNYKMSQIKGGVMDVYCCNKLFFRVCALNAPMSRLKSLFVKNIRYGLMDEFICNLRQGEKYLSDEAMRFKEIYTTYNRESEKGIRFYFHGNPYSLYNPYFTWLGVDSRKLKPGAFVVGKKYVVNCYQISEELKQYILSKNPFYEFDDAYTRYAFNGEAINDDNIMIMKSAPAGFFLRWVFRLQGQLLGVFAGYMMQEDLTPLHYWCKVMKPGEVSDKRNVFIFEFGQSLDGTVMYRKRGNQIFEGLKTAVEYREIAFQTIEASYLMEEIYCNI